MLPIVWREFRTLSTTSLSLILHFVTPLFLLIFFATVLGRNLAVFEYDGMAVQYLEYFTPGLVGYITFMTFQMAFTFIRHDRMSGMLGIIVLSQGSMNEYITGKILAQVAINLLKVLAIVILAMLISRVNVELLRVEHIALFLTSVILGTIVWLSLGLATALLIHRDDVREVLVMIISMPLMFASSMYYDISRAPGWIKAISIVNPLTYICNSARRAYLNETIAGYSHDIIILFIMAIISIIMAIIVSRKIEL